MEIGAVSRVTTGDCSDLHYVDTGMYATPEYGAVYLLDDERPAIVDSGIGTNHELVLDALDAVGIDREELAVIALTHVHLDHAGGAGFIAEACPNAEVYVHEIGAPHVIDPERLVAGTKAAVDDMWKHYVEPRPIPEDRVVELRDGDVIDLGVHSLRVHHAPGHAPHQVVFEDPANDAVFVADAAGLWAPSAERLLPTTPPPQFDLEGCLDDLDTIAEIDPSTLLYPHFGPREADGALDEYARVLEEWVATVAAERDQLGDDEAVLELLAESTDMVELWGEEKGRAEARLNGRGVLAYLDRRA